MKETFIKYFGNKLVFSLFNLLILLSVIYLWVQTFVFPYVGKDGSYYLSVGRDVIARNIGFYEMKIPYNPLGIYLFGTPNFITQNTIYYVYVLLLLISIFNVLLYNKILKILQIISPIRTFATILFVFYTAFLGGTYIYLENITIFFMFIAIIFFLKQQYFLTGSFLFLAFYAKQYGLSLALPFTVYIFLSKDRHNIIKSITLIATGFITLLLLFYSVHSDQINILNFLIRLTGYVDMEGVIKYTGSSNINQWVFDFFRVFGYCLFVPFAIVLITKGYFNKQNIFFISISFCSAISLYFAQYVFYYLLIIPWFIISLAISLNNFELTKKMSIIFKIVALITIFFSLYSIKLGNGKKERYLTMKMELEEIQKYVPAKSKVFLFIDPSYYYYAPYYSSNLQKFGYWFPQGFNNDFIVNNIEPGSFVILNKNHYDKLKDEFDIGYKLIGSDAGNIYLQKP